VAADSFAGTVLSVFRRSRPQLLVRQIYSTEFVLPSTAFLRHDYSEFHRVAPGNELAAATPGSSATAWLMYEYGHACVQAPGPQLPPDARLEPRKTVPPMNVK
jgi:hypothetical protein